MLSSKAVEISAICASLAKLPESKLRSLTPGSEGFNALVASVADKLGIAGNKKELNILRNSLRKTLNSTTILGSGVKKSKGNPRCTLGGDYSHIARAEILKP